MGFSKKSLLLLAGGISLFLASCGKTTEAQKARETQTYYAKGINLFKRGDYEDAAVYLRKAEAGMAYLTPEQIRELKYKLAVALYKAGKYEDAILELEDYISYYPSAPNIEQAYIYLIRAYLKISPDPWRDQTYTEKALSLAYQFLQKFPNSQYIPQVEELIEEAKRKLAKHYYLIAKFYEDYGYYYPAAVRFEYLLLTYPNYIDTHDVLFHYIKNLLLVPQYSRKKISYWREKYDDLRKRIEKGEVLDPKAAKKRLEFYRGQIERWQKIAKEALRKAEENMKIYRQRFGEDKNYKLLLKIKKEGKVEQSWIERIL